jgi:hypothetical protein
MKSFPILCLLLLSLFVNDALAAIKSHISFVDEDLLSAPKKKGKADQANKSTHIPFSTSQSPRVYKSAKQFREIVYGMPKV